MNKRNGLYPVKGNCFKFLHCINKRMYLQACPAGLMFNPKNNSCDWESRLGQDARRFCSAWMGGKTASSLDVYVLNTPDCSTKEFRWIVQLFSWLHDITAKTIVALMIILRIDTFCCFCQLSICCKIKSLQHRRNHVILCVNHTYS